jgi:hypothetical protein
LTDLSAYPWQKVAADLYEWKGRQNAIVVDYNSKYIERSTLSDSTSQGVIQKLKSIFARHGIPEQFSLTTGHSSYQKRSKSSPESIAFPRSRPGPVTHRAMGLSNEPLKPSKTYRRRTTIQIWPYCFTDRPLHTWDTALPNCL